MCSHGWSKEKSTKTAFACSACRTTHFWFWWENEKKRPIIKRFSKGFSPCHSIRTAHLLPYRNESMQSQMKVRGVKTHPLLLVHLEINPFGITFNWKWPNIGKKLWKSFFLHSLESGLFVIHEPLTLLRVSLVIPIKIIIIKMRSNVRATFISRLFQHT